NVLFFFTLIILGRESAYVRRHANQQLALLLWFLASGIVAIVPFLGWIACGAGMIAGVVFLIIAMVKAYHYEVYEIPLFGKWALVPAEA
ncbi:MAG: DUF4870 domain-containing protein, partial [Clostridia bacterium]|nr:DUF4870 domain-containing protein [Clostridia bacterium]